MKKFKVSDIVTSINQNNKLYIITKVTDISYAVRYIGHIHEGLRAIDDQPKYSSVKISSLIALSLEQYLYCLKHGLISNGESNE